MNSLMQGQIELRNYLQSELVRRKQKNTSYSLRSFAKSIGIHPAALSEFLNGKRSFSKRIACKILKEIPDSPDKHHSILKSFESSKGNSKEELKVSKKSLQLQADHYHIVSDPIYYSILSLMETQDYESSPMWIAGRLGLSSLKVEKAIDRMLRLNYLTEKDGKYQPAQEELDTSYDVPNSALKLRQKANLIDAESSLDEVAVELREFCAVTMAIDMSKLAEAKMKMRKFRDELCEYLEEGTKTEVYELSLQLFPRTKTREEKKKITL
ncbi:MAG: TIGR02147 family protein [Bdellovibrionota bacterium]|nr:TIGR02147 family protein [Bdellovibrionota bacterium]